MPKNSLEIFTVDAFTGKPFSGNPAAVCLLDKNKDDGWLLNVASEMNLSETAFLLRTEDGYDLRWFTPKVEVELCGHATLASAHILRKKGLIDDKVRFHTKSGVLTVSYNDDVYTLDFPATFSKEANPPAKLVEALGVKPVSYYETEYNCIVEVEDEGTLRELSPDFSLLMELPLFGTIVTALSKDGQYDFISRYFVPAKGINEDPVTGSAHCALGPYWMEKTGKTVFFAYQASKRGGEVKLEINDDRVLLKGKAVIVTEGRLFV